MGRRREDFRLIPALAQVSARQWQLHRLRTALTMLGVALGVAVFFAVRTANATLLESLTSTVDRLAGKSTLEVTAGETGFPEKILDIVRATPGVAAAEPVIEVTTQTGFPDEGNLLILGVDTTGDQALREYQFDRSQTQIGDPLVYLAQPNSILLSRSFAQRHGLRIGSSIPLFTSNGRKDFAVQGLFQPTGIGQAFGGNIAVMDVYAAEVVFDRGRNFDRIDLMNDQNVSVGTVQQRLKERLPAGIEVVRPEVRAQALENVVTAMRIVMLIASMVALLVGIYLVFNSFTIAVNQRWKEIGILRAVGVSRGGIAAMFLGEAALLGAIGSIGGVAAGFLAASAANRVMSSIASSVYGVVSVSEATHFHAGLAWLSVALGVMVSFAGAWLPAQEAAGLDPAMALHNVEARSRESTVKWQRAAIGLALVVLSWVLMIYSPIHVGMIFQFGYLALTLSGLTLLLPRLVRVIAYILRPIMDWIGGAEGALAVDAMIESPGRTSATVGALMVGLMFVFATAAYIQSYRSVIDRWMSQVVNADLFVATSAMLRSTSYHFSEELGEKIVALPDVKRVENVRFTSIPFRGDTSALVAIEMDGFLARASSAIEDGDVATAQRLLAAGEAVLVSRNFANRWHISSGERVLMDSPSGTLDLPVAGIVDDYRSEKGTIFLDRAVYKKYWNDAAVDFVDIDLKTGADPDAAKREIQRITLGSQHAFIYTNIEFRRWVAGLVDQFFTLNYMQLIVAALVGTVGIVNALVISIAERRREFGIVRALGAFRGQVRKLVLLEAVAICFAGVILGSVAALFDIQFMSRTVSMVLAGYTVPFKFPWLWVLWSFPAFIFIALVAAWCPAQRAMSLAVSEAIGYE